MGVKKVSPGSYAIDARVTIAGREIRRRERFTGTIAEARDRHAQLRTEIRGFDASPGGSLKSTVGWVFKNLLDLYQHGRTFSKGYHALMGAMERDLGDVPLSEFPDRFEQYVSILRSTPSAHTGRMRKPHAINRVIQCARAVFNAAVGRALMQTNPITKYRFPMGKETARDVTLTEVQRTQLLNVVDTEAPHLSAVVRFALAVPCRKSDLVYMRREDLDLINGAIRVRNGTTKNDMGVWKPIPPDQVSYFRELPPDTEYLFYRRDRDGVARCLGDFKRAWKRCLRLAGLAGLHFHDSRHVSATDMLNRGTPEHVVMTVAGWKSNMLKTYYHRTPLLTMRYIRWSDGHPPDTLGVENDDSVQKRAV